jgi:hypothetical protein
MNCFISSSLNDIKQCIIFIFTVSEKFKRTRSKSGMPVEKHIICQNPILEEDKAKDFFTYRDGLVENAVRECISDLVVPDKDGEILGSWLLTE